MQLALPNNTEGLTSSLELVKQINFFRLEEGNRSEILHKDFLKIIRDEFEEEVNGGEISLVDYTDKKGEKRPMFNLTYEESTQLLMRESKIVRKAVSKWLKARQQPQSFSQALYLAAKQQEIIEQQQLQLSEKTIEVNKLNEALDYLLSYASIIKIAQHFKVKESYFNWRLLKNKSHELGEEIKKARSPRYDYQNLYSIRVWQTVYPQFDYSTIKEFE